MARRIWLAGLVLMGNAVAGTYTDQVDPFIGTDGTGHVFPGASAPWGMVAPGPDMAGGGWDYTSGYQYQGRTLLGFSNTHISGAGIPELGDVLLLPASATAWPAAPDPATASYDKGSERAHPGYYAVRLPALGVNVELTATPRVAVHRWTFDRPGRVKVLVDLDHGLLYGDAPRVKACRAHVDAPAGELGGEADLHGWVERKLGFIVHFDHPILAQTTLAATRPGAAPRYLFEFDLAGPAVLEARVALSTVDEAGARGNLATAGTQDFDRIRRQTDGAWETLLGRVQIDADQRTRRIFYSALYRSLLHPSDIADADARVRGPQGEVMAAPGGRYDSTLSLWDTFRALNPLYTLIWPERVDGFIRTFLAHYHQQGYLPLWTAWGRETHTMIGNPALPIMADAIAKGFHGFDRADALQAMVETSTRERPAAPPWAQRGWATYEQKGYLPFDLEPNESISRTLEYGIGDDAVARAAGVLGRPDIARRFAQRARGWHLVFDPAARTVRGRDSAGHWRTPFDPLEVTSPLGHPGDYTEGNAWQYTATPALFDPVGFRDALGGPAALEQWLDTFFALPMPHVDRDQGQEALIGQYAHGNEPSHHIAWLYEFSSAPQKTDAMLSRITREFYADGPGGIIGNDDCGQMSAWLVFAMLGIYPVEPASARYVAALPQIDRARIALPQGRVLVIRRSTLAGARWQGKTIERTAITHAQLVKGGTLELGPSR